MRNKKLIVKVMTGLIAAGLTLSSGISASAKSDDAAASNEKLTITQGKVGNKKVVFGEDIKTQLESLVESGTITKEQSDKITEFMNAQKEERKAEMEKVKNMTVEERKAYFESQKDTKKIDMLKTLVDNGIISQEQADKLKAAFSKDKEIGKGIGYKIKINSEGLKTTLDTLVESGKITQAQEDKIISFMNEKSEAMKAEMEKVKNMTVEERKAYFESQKDTEKTDIFKTLVDNGIISQDQADKIKASLPEKKDAGKGFGYKIKINSEGLKTTLDTLVESGKITQAQEDKIISFMNEKSEAMKAEMEKVKSMTKDERKAYFESQKGTQRIDMFKELVDSGTLTQAEADTIKAAMPKMERVKHINGDTTTDTTINESTN